MEAFKLGGVQMYLSKQNQYLGVILDYNWNAHIEYVISKGTSLF